MRKIVYFTFVSAALISTSCKKKEGCTDPTALNYDSKAKKDNGTCEYGPVYTVPTTYSFTNSSGQSTVDYSGQTDRINQLTEMMAYIETGEIQAIDAQVLKDMFQNTGGNGNGNFSFTSTRQLKDKLFSLDVSLMESYFDSVEVASQSFATTASNGQAGTLTSGLSKYLFSKNGIEYAELIEKTAIGGVFMYQALNVYFGPSKMNVDNTTPVSGQTYTAMQHHWDEAFGYFGVPTNFPAAFADDFWGKYCNTQNPTLNSNGLMMNNFLKGRAAIGAAIYADRDDAIYFIRRTWEDIAAYQAMTYLNGAITNYGVDQAKCLHNLNEAYGLIFALRYAPLETRRISQTQLDQVLADFGTNFWNVDASEMEAIKATIDGLY